MRGEVLAHAAKTLPRQQAATSSVIFFMAASLSYPLEVHGIAPERGNDRIVLVMRILRMKDCTQISSTAFESYCIAPTALPSESRKKIRWPTVGMRVRGMRMVPPFATTAAATASTSATETVHS